MKVFDALPKPLREAISNATYGHTSTLQEAYNQYRKGKKISSIIKWLENRNLTRESAAPAEREAAQAFLKELGL